MIDADDFELVNSYKWYLSKSKHTFYARGYKKDIPSKFQKETLMHRLIMNAPDGIDVDHNDRNGINNHQPNLNLMLRSGNIRKAKVFNKTGYKGVFERPSGRFAAIIRINGRKTTLGTFDTAEDASNVYQKEYENQLLKETVK